MKKPPQVSSLFLAHYNNYEANMQTTEVPSV